MPVTTTTFTTTRTSTPVASATPTPATLIVPSKEEKRIALISKCTETTTMMGELKKERRKLSKKYALLTEMAWMGGSISDLKPIAARIGELDKRIEVFRHISVSINRSLHDLRAPAEETTGSKKDKSDKKTKA